MEYTVKKGDSLWKIARRYTGRGINYKDIVKINPQIKNPDLIFPNQKLNIPENWNKQDAQQTTQPKKVSGGQKPVAKPSTKATKPVETKKDTTTAKPVVPPTKKTEKPAAVKTDTTKTVQKPTVKQDTTAKKQPVVERRPEAPTPPKKESSSNNSKQVAEKLASGFAKIGEKDTSSVRDNIVHNTISTTRFTVDKPKTASKKPLVFKREEPKSTPINPEEFGHVRNNYSILNPPSNDSKNRNLEAVKDHKRRLNVKDPYWYLDKDDHKAYYFDGEYSYDEPMFTTSVLNGVGNKDLDIINREFSKTKNYKELAQVGANNSGAGIYTIDRVPTTSPYGRSEEGVLATRSNPIGEPEVLLRAQDGTFVSNAMHSAPSALRERMWDNIKDLMVWDQTSGCWSFPPGVLRQLYKNGYLNAGDSVYIEPQQEGNYLYEFNDTLRTMFNNVPSTLPKYSHLNIPR